MIMGTKLQEVHQVLNLPEKEPEKEKETEAAILREDIGFPPCHGDYLGDELCSFCPRVRRRLIEKEKRYFMKKICPNRKFVGEILLSSKLEILKDLARDIIYNPNYEKNDKKEIEKLAMVLYNCRIYTFFLRKVLKVKPLWSKEKSLKERAKYLKKLKTKSY